MHPNLLGADLSILYFFNSFLSSPFLDLLMPLLTFGGTQVFWVILCLILYLLGGEDEKEAAFIALTALVMGFFLSESLKMVIARPRPYEVIGWVRHTTVAGGYSMPSGHTVAAFAGFISLYFKFGSPWLFIILASLVGTSRIYLGLHYPSDVLAGAVLGVLCAFTALKIEERVKCFGLCRFDRLQQH
ncbi:undecaprenyl-diphosphatase [Methanothermobacter defluvii]|uniref:Undecaprenyl-diphosphatase n=1 Tax=Methanothermobacter defluvii TaxID=49339 RepID=A0A371NF00_9EURY|nr:phosphatase PAP2 family protein [Methanothermobacter defluvii]REE28568.1 undecaprenyl-diphosphatase [Methanothermobacter defluvii]